MSTNEEAAPFNPLARIPSRYEWARFDAAELMTRLRLDAGALSDIMYWLGSRHRSGDPVISVTGGVGCGKTSLAVATLCAIESDELRRCYVSAFDIATARQQHPLGEGEAAVIRHAKAAPILVIDDIGREATFGRNVVAEVIHHRYDNQRMTIAATHLDLAEVCKLYGDGVARRLFGGVPFPRWTLHEWEREQP